MQTDKCIILGLLLICFVYITSGRQMCYSCSYNIHPFKMGYNCVTNPKNWTVGDWRMRCPYRCTSSSHYDKETGDATYFYRGCSGGDDVPEDGCTEDELKYYCYFSCTGHYCNDGPAIDETMMEDIDIEDDKSASKQLNICYTVIMMAMILSAVL